ncbi:hypothetical protein KUTeg_024968 [Tegillarca granosa]|uniref:Uncharacterized protein n=1 Tax=Tegillarca granosa TaxID=220873 RepID=A0ABQ9E4D8_TEGGR|nr:hypothetical protein KUTeg_024968 [Tegillarca granosa]
MYRIRPMPNLELHLKFVEWYAKQVSDQLKWGVRIENVIVDLKTRNVKPIHANWLLSVFDEISKDKHCVIEGFELASISEVLSDTLYEKHVPFNMFNVLLFMSFF